MTEVTPGPRALGHDEGSVRGMAEVTAALGGRIAYGGDYNPEQWPPEVWEQDVALMAEAGVNLVTVGVFSWALVEPAEKEYDFGWLDRVLDLLHARGIRVDLANASATPPPWFSHAYPDSMPVDADGVRHWYGGRQAFCPSSPDYRVAAARLTETMVKRYAGHPAVVMWHVHNEYGCHNWNCFCDTSAAAFREWLRERYGSLDQLNRAWGTAFWSQHYSDWAQVIPPRTTAYNTFANPTQQLDFWRFSSDELLGCFRAEAQILRAQSSQPVTTNFMGFFKPLDYWAWAKEQDLVSNDHYLLGSLDDEAASHDLSMGADLMRSLAGGDPWLLMEHSTSAVNWQPRNLAKAPGQMRRNSLTHVARGTDGVMFFQWRASGGGAEKFHSGMVPHGGTDTRQWDEVVALGRDLASIAEVNGTRVQADVAILFDWQSWWGVELNSHPSGDVDQMTDVRAWHRSLWERGVTCDFAHPEGDLSSYRLVLVPQLYLASDAASANLSSFVQAGGHVVVGWFSGIVDQDDHIRLGGYPGAFRDLLGVRMVEFAPLRQGESVRVEGLSVAATGTMWTERGAVTDAQVVARYLDGPAAGDPAVTRRGVGAGAAWYLGTRLDPAGLDEVLGTALHQAGVDPVIEGLPAGIEAVRRRGADSDYLFVMNHTGGALIVPVEGADLLTGAPWSPRTSLPGGGVAVIRS